LRLGVFASRQQAISYVAPIASGIVHGTLHSLRKSARIERWNLCKIAHVARVQNEALPPVRILLDPTGPAFVVLARPRAAEPLSPNPPAGPDAAARGSSRLL